MMPSMPPDGFADEPEMNGPPDGFADESPEPMSFEGFKQNAMKGAVGNVQAVGAVGSLLSNYFPLNIPKQIYDTAAGNPMQQPPIERDAKIIGTVARELPGAMVDSVTRYADPVKAAYDDPVTTAIDAATLGGLAKPAATLAKGVGTAVKSAPRRILQSASKGVFESPVGRRFISAAFGPSEEAIASRVTRPKSILKAKPTADLADDLSKSMGDIQGQIREGSEAAGKTLNPDLFNSDGVQLKRSVTKRINDLQRELQTGGTVVGEAEQIAFNKLEKLKGRISEMNDGKKGLFNDRITETNIEGIIKSIDPDINYDSAVNSVANEKLMRLRTELDSSLKRRNPKYRSAMAPVSERMRTFEGVRKKFNLRKGEKGVLGPDNATASNLEAAVSDKKSTSRRLLRDVKKFTGRDYLQEVRDWKVAEQFQPGMRRPNGSRMVNWGGATGGGLGSTVGATIGGAVGGVPGAIVGGGIGGALGTVGGVMTGGYMDKQGGAIAAKLIDMYLRNKGGSVAAKAVNPAVEEFAPVLLDAVEKTGITLEEAAATLSQSNPSFKQFIFEVIEPDDAKPGRILKNTNDAAEAPQDETEPQEAKVLDEDTARQYLKQAGGNKAKARKLAMAEGWTIA